MPDAWTAYFDDLAAMVREVDVALADGRAPVLPLLQRPAAPPPADALARRAELLADLARVTGRLTGRRDELGHEIASLAPPRPTAQGDRETALGGSLDLVG